jgi:hypothetical protein
MVSPNLKIQSWLTTSLRGYNRHARKHPKKQLRQIAESIKRFGFNVPILITPDGEIIAGHGRWEAAKQLQLETVPIILIDHLTEEERRAFILADNKIALNATFDQELLALELQSLIDIGFDATLTGFDTAEIDLVLDNARQSNPVDELSAQDTIPPLNDVTVTRRGDMWQLGRHVLLCGDARNPADYQQVLFGEAADLLFTDPPFNTRVSHIIGMGAIQHREFAMASGESSFENVIGEPTISSVIHRCLPTTVALEI